jgi:hypothetical protein
MLARLARLEQHCFPLLACWCQEFVRNRLPAQQVQLAAQVPDYQEHWC